MVIINCGQAPAETKSVIVDLNSRLSHLVFKSPLSVEALYLSYKLFKKLLNSNKASLFQIEELY